MRKIIVLVCVVFSVNVFSQTTDWVKACGGVESDKGISIGTDSLGYIYISGFFNGEADFGPYTLYASYPNNKNIFVAKMDSLGNFIWAVAGTGGPYDDRALGMHVDKAGNVYITGTFWGYVEFPSASGPVSVGGNGCDTSVLIKIDKDGNCVFAIQVCTGTGSGSCPWPIYDCDDHSYDVKVDDDGFIYITGFYSTFSADFGPSITLNNPNWNNCQPAGYIGKWDATGNVIWVESFDGIKDQRGSRDNRIALDQFSNIYVCGGYQGTANYGPLSLTSIGEWDAFIFKMDKDGNWLWAESVGSNKTDRANSIVVDVCGDIYICGEYRNPMVFPGANASNGTDTLSHKKKRDIFVAKMNNQGKWKWAKRARSSGTDKPYQMSVDANKQVFLCGTAGGETTFSNGLVVDAQIPGDTTMSAWVAQIDGASNNGDWLWAKMAGSSTDDDDRTNDICPDGFGNVYAIGFYEDLANFDGTILDATGRRKDIFIWKMSMTPGSFTINNTYDTLYADSMVFNPADTGIFTNTSFVIDGCDTAFVDSVVHQKLGVQINYNINNPGTATFTINGMVQAMPYSQNYFAGEIISVVANLQPNWLFSQWRTSSNTVLPSVNSITATFMANASDSCVLVTYPKPALEAFISGNDTICDNANKEAEVKIFFSGAISPFTFVYAINGKNKPSITTTLNPYIIRTKEEGNYTLTSFADAITVGWISGSAMVTIMQSPTALFTTVTDTLSILFPSVQLNDVTLGNIVDWQWDFGDNTLQDFTSNPYHTFQDSIGVYQLSLIVTDDLGCRDTTFKQMWIADEYWMYIPSSFTPDLDGVNDVFCLSYHGIREATFYFNIYDRFSNLVYATENIADLECFLNSNGWDGKHFKTGIDLPMGTYIYEVYFQDFQGWKHQDMGHLFIIR